MNEWPQSRSINIHYPHSYHTSIMPLDNVFPWLQKVTVRFLQEKDRNKIKNFLSIQIKEFLTNVQFFQLFLFFTYLLHKDTNIFFIDSFKNRNSQESSFFPRETLNLDNISYGKWVGGRRKDKTISQIKVLKILQDLTLSKSFSFSSLDFTTFV